MGTPYTIEELDSFNNLHEAFFSYKDEKFENTEYDYDYVGDYESTKCISANERIQYEPDCVYTNFRLRKVDLDKIERISLEIGGQQFDSAYSVLSPVFSEFIGNRFDENLDRTFYVSKRVPADLIKTLIKYITPISNIGIELSNLGIPSLLRHDIVFKTKEKISITYDIHKYKGSKVKKNVLFHQWHFTGYQEPGKDFRLTFRHPLCGLVGLSDTPVKQFTLCLKDSHYDLFFESVIKANNIKKVPSGYLNVYHFPKSISLSIDSTIRNSPFKGIWARGKQIVTFYRGMAGLAHSC